MTASDSQSSPSTPQGAPLDYREPRLGARDGSGTFLPMIAALATFAALPAGLGVNVILPAMGILSRQPITGPERFGFSSADWAGFSTVVVLALIGAMIGFWFRTTSTVPSLRGRAMATLAAYGGLLILVGCLMVVLTMVSRV